MSTEPKMSQISVSDVAREHDAWLRSKGEHGRRANFDGLNLWDVEFRSLIPNHNFTGAEFGSAQLFRANLRGCNLQFADLHNTRGLSSEALAGSDLSGARLPELLGWSGELELLSAKASTAQSIFLTILTATIYIILTVIDTTDLDLVTNSTTLSLPVLSISVPVIPFFAVGPLALCILFIYFCFLQRETLQLLNRMPMVMPDGSLPAARAFSWLPAYGGATPGQHESRRGFWGNFISAMIVYATVPLALVCIWERGLVARHGKLTALHVVLIALATGFCWYLLYFQERGGPAMRQRRWFAALAVVAVLLLAYLSLAVLKGGRSPKSEYLGSILPSGVAPDHYDSMSYYYDRNDTDREYGWAIPGRRLLHLLHLDPYPNLNRARSSAEATGSEETGGGLSFPAGWEQRHLPAKNSRLVGVDMSNCDLEGADLRSAILTKARLIDCNLEGATLSKAKVEKANLSGTSLDRAILTDANLSGTDLSETSFSEVIAEGANLSNTHLNDVSLKDAWLRNAELDGADLTGADLTGAHLDAITVNKSDLTSVHLDGAVLQGASINASPLRAATLRNADLTNASILGSDLTGADLSCTRVAGASFTGSDLSGANLTGMMNRRHDPRPYEAVDFSVKTMTGANLHGANLISATGLSAKQVQAAKNWTEAFYSPEFLQQLGLPPNHNEQLEIQLAQDKSCDAK